jgi:hypothetical protein
MPTVVCEGKIVAPLCVLRHGPLQEKNWALHPDVQVALVLAVALGFAFGVTVGALFGALLGVTGLGASRLGVA